MHFDKDKLRKLAAAYCKGQMLDDEQLEIKRHMAECDECYGVFCTLFVIQKELSDQGLLDDEIRNAASETTAANLIMQISKLKEKVSKSHLLLTVKEAFSGEARWSFADAGRLAAVRGEQGGESYRSSISDESNISYSGGKLNIVLDEEEYDGDRLYLSITDGEKMEHMEFHYDEDMGLYSACVDLDEWSENVVVNLLQL